MAQMRFSQRTGKRPIKKQLQIESMDSDLRNGLWNVLQPLLLPLPGQVIRREILSNAKSFLTSLWRHFLKQPVDSMPASYRDTYEMVRGFFFDDWEWNEVYDFVEFVCQHLIDYNAQGQIYVSFFNDVLDQELAGYRIIGTQIVPITDENELGEIEDAIRSAGISNLSGVRSHLERAVALLSDKKNPDYRNSIKESISAVEALARIITGDPKATLGKALDVIEGKIPVHAALKAAFDKLYGYASDADGIRHAMLDESQCDFEDAKYMLVACSAFINYLIAKTAKAAMKL